MGKKKNTVKACFQILKDEGIFSPEKIKKIVEILEWLRCVCMCVFRSTRTCACMNVEGKPMCCCLDIIDTKALTGP